MSVTVCARALDQGETTAVALTRACLAKIADPLGEGSRAFLSVNEPRALREADASDARRSAGRTLGPLDGIPVGVKDLFDVAGEVTTAGSVVLQGAAQAVTDASAVARLRAAGMIVLGRTHMNEFAYSAMGWNPHHPTPRAPWDRGADGGRGRAPGGSTSGGSVAVADGLIQAALGSDTGGSTRIPAAFCGITGFRPSQGRVPSSGAFPLAHSFDVVGPVARSVADIRLLDGVLSGETNIVIPAPLSLAVAKGLPFDALDPEVLSAIQTALARLVAAGIALPDMDFAWGDPGDALRSGQVTAVEALVAHGALYDRRAEYDPRVAQRMALGLPVAATAYVAAQARIMDLRRQFDAGMTADAVLMPTVAILPPRLAELDDDSRFFDLNGRALRNTMIANVLDLPAISLPLPGGPPVGLMLMGRRGSDRGLLALAETVETIIKG